MRAAALVVVVVVALAACGGSGDASKIEAPGPVEPGTYEGDPFEPAIQLTLDEQGWRALFAAEDDELALEHEDGRFLAFTRVTRVVDPKTNEDVPAPKDLAQWLRDHPALQPTSAAPASVGGASGTRIDTAAPESDTEIFWFPEGALRAIPKIRWRAFLLDVGGSPLTIVYGAPIASFDEALTKLEPLLASIELD